MLTTCPHNSFKQLTAKVISLRGLVGRAVGTLAIFCCLMSMAGAEDSLSDQRSLALLFGDELEQNALELYRRSRQMPVEARFEYLLKNVLPRHSNQIRLTIDYLPTNPSPPVVEMYGSRERPLGLTSSENRRPAGGVLISPAFELVDAAKELQKLEELQVRTRRRSVSGIEQVKARLVLETLIAWNLGDFEQAGARLNELNSVVRSSPINDRDRSPESLVIWAGMGSTKTRDQIYDLLYLLFEQVHTPGVDHRERFKRHISSFKFQVDQLQDRKSRGVYRAPSGLSLQNWSPVSRRTAESRGEGFPNASWVTGPASVRKLTCHDDDYLYFASPLRGNFEIESNLTTYDLREIRLAVGGYWAGSRFTLNECENGFFRHQLPLLPIEPPLTNVGSLLRGRTVVREGARATFINGRNIYQRPHGPDADPWIAIFCPWNTSGTAQNLRITGHPQIPNELDLISSADLPGWLPYFQESAGGRETDWRLAAAENDDSDILIGTARTELRGATHESLLRYHRPMLEDGTIEYEFYYRQGKFAVYPALDRRCFLFDRERVGIHWLTDGTFDRTGLDPANFTELGAGRAEAKPVPLRPNAWNHTRLTLRGDTVEIALNGETISTGTLEPENQRTFGLFHYADLTEARVRNLRWRGEWPKSLPQPRQQELADYSLEDQLAAGPELPVVFEHDFSKGLPSNKIWGGGREGWHFHMQECPEGVRIDKRGGWYSHHTLSLPIEVKGDFDITLAYEAFQSTVVPEGEGDVQLELIFADELETDFRLYRKHHHRKNGKHEQIVEAGLFQQLENTTHRDWPAQYAEESNAGIMHAVRRGDQLFLLHSTAGSPHNRLLYRQQVTTAPIRFGGVKAIVETHLDSKVSVMWKRITVRAETPTKFTVRDSMTVEKLDQQRSELAQSESVTFNQRTPETQFWIWGNADILKQSDGWQLQQPGTEEWKWCGFNWRRGIKGDYDLTLELDVVKMEEPDGDHETYFLLKNRRTSSFFQGAEFKISSTRHGKRELIVQQNTSRRNGSNRYEKIKIQPVKTVTHLRFARRGDVLYFLYRSEGGTKDQILGYTVAGADDLPPTSLLTMGRTGGAGKETVLKLKSMDLHAERLIKPDP